MPEVVKSVLVPYTASEMFDLVDRVEDYPAFLPWCGGTELHRRDEQITAATIHIRFMQIRQHFSTENQKRIPEEMQIRLTRGPFRRLHGHWRFFALGETACKVEFHLHYEFSSSLLEQVLGPVFNHIAHTFIDAFMRRAEAVYGARS